MIPKFTHKSFNSEMNFMNESNIVDFIINVFIQLVLAFLKGFHQDETCFTNNQQHGDYRRKLENFQLKLGS